MDAVYTTRERVMRAADVKATAYLTAEIDEAIAAGARAIDRLCHRGDTTRPGFAPWQGTITFDWPALNNSYGYRFYLNQNALYSLTSAVSGGATITADALLRPETGPPYSMLDVNRGTGSILTQGSAAGQGSLAVTGVWLGCGLQERTVSTWQLSGNINSSTDQVTVNAPVGVGDIVRIDSERMIVKDRRWADSGQAGSLTAARDAQTLAVSTGSVFLPGEELLLGAERVLVREVAGNNLVVQRAVAGSVLAAHTTADIYWSRSFTVTRGALGTTAAAHSDEAAVYVYQPPPLVEQLNIAYALDMRAQESSAYARTVGTGDAERAAPGGGIKSLEERVWAAHGRKLRHRAV